jgi:lipoprotein NlpI
MQVKFLLLVPIFSFWTFATTLAQAPNENLTLCGDAAPDVAIAGCTAFIRQYGTVSDGPFVLRGNAYATKGQYDLAIADFDQAITINPNEAITFRARGSVYLTQGRYERAIVDFDIAISRDPNDAAAFVLRSSIYTLEGQYDRAIQDQDQVIRLNPNDAQASSMRGLNRFALGRFVEALADFERSVELEPMNAYWPLWSHLVLSKLGRTDSKELSNNLAKFDLAKWPGPIVGFYRGQKTPEVVRAAALMGDSGMQRDQSCEAAFYIGEYEWLRGNADSAKPLLQEAANTCQHSSYEYIAAISELKRLP